MNPHTVSQGEAESKSYCWVKTRHSEMKQSLVGEGNHFLRCFWPWQLTNTPGGGADPQPHKNGGYDILQELWHKALNSLNLYCACLFILKYKILNKKNFKIHECIFVVKISYVSIHSRKAKFLRTTLLNPNSFHRSNSKKAWEKHTAFQICYLKIQIVS